MSILRDIITGVYHDAYPLVRNIINNVKGVVHEIVEKVEEKAIAAAELVEEKAGEVLRTVENTVEEVKDDLPPWGYLTAQILDARAAQRGLIERTDYDWRHSPVDLLKLVNRPSEFSARQTLARLFGMPEYSGTEAQGEELLKRIKEWLSV